MHTVLMPRETVLMATATMLIATITAAKSVVSSVISFADVWCEQSGCAP